MGNVIYAERYVDTHVINVNDRLWQNYLTSILVNRSGIVFKS